jgi:hypothetical protein
MCLGHMRRIHSSHNWKSPAAERLSRPRSAAPAVQAQRRAFTDAGAEGMPRQRLDVKLGLALGLVPADGWRPHLSDIALG